MDHLNEFFFFFQRITNHELASIQGRFETLHMKVNEAIMVMVK